MGIVVLFGILVRTIYFTVVVVSRVVLEGLRFVFRFCFMSYVCFSRCFFFGVYLCFF